jgi:hypothetical protein
MVVEGRDNYAIVYVPDLYGFIAAAGNYLLVV